MADRPYVLLSCCMSLDGHLDDSTDRRLVLSNPADLDRVDELRAGCDAILVGAGTVRRDDPRLLVRSAARREARAARGRPGSPLRVTLTTSGRLDPAARVFATGDGAAVVYCPQPHAAALREALGARAAVVGVRPGDPLTARVDLAAVLEDLSDRGVERLLVEGGESVITQLLSAGLVDQLDLAVAPVLVGDPSAPRVAGAGRYPWTVDRRARLADVQRVGDVALLRYALSDRYGEP